MKPFRPFPQCVECLVSLARSSAEMAAPHNPGFQEEAEEEARKILDHAMNSDLSSPEIANRILRKIKQAARSSDPFFQFKAEEMVRAKEIFSQVKDRVGQDLRSLVSLSVLGNSLDFFRDPQEALDRIPDQLQKGLSFYRDQVDRLEAFLDKGPALVLYLSDNSGEIFFDIPLYNYIRERSHRTVLVVKGGPSLNDLTRKELNNWGLEAEFDEVVDTGTDGAGVDWGQVSESFLSLVEEADLIVSKGMANFETLYGKDLAPAIFFLFRVKCSAIQDYVKAPAESFMALWQEGVGKRQTHTVGGGEEQSNE